MTRRILFCLIMILGLGPGAGVHAHAASIYMVATGENAIDDRTFDIVEGATYRIEIWMDFSDIPTIGGAYDVMFDAQTFAFESWTPAGFGDPAFEMSPTLEPGRLVGAAVGSLDVPLSGPALMATVTFGIADFLTLGVGDTIAPGVNAATGGQWPAALNLIVLQPSYSGVTFVPVPAAVWLFVSALAGLGATQWRSRLALR